MNYLFRQDMFLSRYSYSKSAPLKPNKISTSPVLSNIESSLITRQILQLNPAIESKTASTKKQAAHGNFTFSRWYLLTDTSTN